MIWSKVASDSGWKPLEELLVEIHEGDPCMTALWPCHYGGVEPLNKRSRDWRTRYAAVFQLASATTALPIAQKSELGEGLRPVEAGPTNF